MAKETTDELIRGLKHQFMTFRNGIVADTLRQAGYPYKVIFGLQLPQLTMIAGDVPADADRATLARALWRDTEVRESRIIAPFFIDPKTLTGDGRAEVMRMCEETRTPEECEMLAFKVLRFLPDAAELVKTLPAPVAKALARFLD